MDEEFRLNTNLPNGVTLLTSNEEFADSYVTEFWTLDSVGGRSSVITANTNSFSATLTHRAIVKLVEEVIKEE